MSALRAVVGDEYGNAGGGTVSRLLAPRGTGDDDRALPMVMGDSVGPRCLAVPPLPLVVHSPGGLV